MLRSRIAAVAAAGLLGLGLTAAGPAFADGSSQAAPTVTQTTPGSFTVDLPGVGSLTFSVDSAGAVSNVVATPATGFTGGTPAVTSEGVQVTFTGANGPQTLQVEVENEDGVVKVTAESDQPDQEDQANTSSTSTTEAEHEDTSTTPTTEAEHEDGNTATSTTATTEAEHEDNTTTTTQSTTQSSDNTSSDGGSSDGGSSDGGSTAGSSD